MLCVVAACFQVSVSPTAIVCTFVFQPQSLLEQLSRYKRAAAEEELREKQLGALRVDLCSPEALKRLKGQLVSSGLPLLHRRHLFIFLFLLLLLHHRHLFHVSV